MARGKRKTEAVSSVQGLRDDLGKGLDEDIVLPVAAFRSLGIETTQSCQGHEDWGTSYPWIDLEIADEDRSRISRMLPSFDFVKRGSDKYPLSWKLVPREVEAINSPDPRDDWSDHQRELQDFARGVLDV